MKDLTAEEKLQDYRCPCHTCGLFNCQEGKGWEDICNGSYIVHCLDGKDRNVNLNIGCCDYQHDSHIKACEVKS